MNKQTKRQIRDAIAPLLSSESAHVILQAAMVLCSIDGIWCSDLGMSDAPTKVAAQITLAKQGVFERLEQKRAQRKAANRRNYLRRKLKALQVVNNTEEDDAKETIN